MRPVDNYLLDVILPFVKNRILNTIEPQVQIIPEEQPQPLIQMRDVVKAYATGERPFIALRDINLEINPGEFLGITGKSGAGKTTLLNMISGVSELTSGEVLFTGNSHGNGASPHKSISIHTLHEDVMDQVEGRH